MTDNDVKLVDLALEIAAKEQGVAGTRFNILRRAPIRRAYLARQLKAELEAEGITYTSVGSID